MIHTINVFKTMCEWSANIYLHSDVHSIRHIAKHLEVSQYQVTKHIHRLRKYGLVKRAYDGGIDEDGQPHCYHGWSLTEKGASTKTYKKEYKKDVEYINDLLRKGWYDD